MGLPKVQKLAAGHAYLGEAGNPPSLEDFISFVKANNLAKQERFYVELPGDVLPGFKKDIRLLCNNITLPGKTITNKNIRLNGFTERRAGTLDYGGENITLEFLVDSDYDIRQFFEAWMGLCVSERRNGNEVGFYLDYAKVIELNALMPAGIPGEKYLNLNLDNVKGLQEVVNKAGNASAALRKTIGFGLNKANNFIAKKKGELLNAVERRTAGIRNAGALGLARDLLTESENPVLNVKLLDCWPISINPMPMSWSSPGVAMLSVTFSYKTYSSVYEYDYMKEEQMRADRLQEAAFQRRGLEEFREATRKDPNSLYNTRLRQGIPLRTP